MAVSTSLTGLEHREGASLAGPLRQDGVVDFASDRCRLDGPESALVLDGATVYQALRDGRWTRQSGRPGQWSVFHPTWAFEALRLACGTTEVTAPGRMRVRLDREPLAAITFAGLARDWVHITAEVTLDDREHVAAVGIDLVAPRANDTDARMQVGFELTGFTAAVDIRVPDPARTIDLAQYLSEAFDTDEWPDSDKR
ncbi:MAG: hypothetical protein ACRDN9_10640 [Streptosporangiaceae bacterium]